MKKFAFVLGLAACTFSLVGCGNNKDQEKPFTPSLDTDKEVVLTVQGKWDNFEALVEVETAFQQYYPKVSIQYSKLKSYITVLENGGCDFIFNTASSTAWAEGAADLYKKNILDLNTAGIDFSNIKEGALKSGQLDGAQYGVHIYEDFDGLLVNEDLLTTNGFSVPSSLAEFEAICDHFAKKDPEYRPIVGYPKEIGRVVAPFTFGNILNASNRDSVIEHLNTGVADSAVFSGIAERFYSWKEKNYFNEPETAVENNYESLIFKFFEGKAPFALGTGGTISGCKKRETKAGSTYGDHPFKYSFITTPNGEKGKCTVLNNTTGMFAIDKRSENLDYCKEFLRFAIRRESLATFSSVKGMAVTGKNIECPLFKQYNSMSSANIHSVDSVGMLANSYSKLRESLDSLKNDGVTAESLAETYYNKVNPASN